MAEKKTKARGLGTGLGALFGEEEKTAPEAEPLFLPISRVEPRKDQPRRVFDKEAIFICKPSQLCFLLYLSFPRGQTTLPELTVTTIGKIAP